MRYWMLILVLLGIGGHASQATAQKTILVLSSRGGYGHTAAANTLEHLIGDRYHLQVVHPIDQLRIWGVPSGEQFYNMLLKRGWIRSTNFLARHVAPTLFRSRESKMEELIDEYISAHQPELIISVIPYVNYPASEAARKQGIPYLLITTDNDLKNWSYELDKIIHPEFRVTIGHDLPSTRGLLMKKQIPPEAIETIGLPLRKEFTSDKDLKGIRNRHQIPEEKATILIMMGGSGGKSAYEYARKIGKMDLDTHLIVCAGYNEKLKKNLSKIKLHPSNSMTILGFTQEVADLMAISDLIITKPGPGTINEAISMQLPVLIDNVDAALFWEKANMDMVVRYGIGERITDYDDVKGVLKAYLYDRRVQRDIETSFALMPPNRFHVRIQEIVDEMINSCP